MTFTLLPKFIHDRISNWAFERSSKVYGRSRSNGMWAHSPELETKMAYEAILRNVWMYSSIYAIATSAAELPCGIYNKGPATKGGDFQLEDQDPISKLMQRPNPIQTRSEFIEACFWSLELGGGKLFIECVPNKQNPKELWVLDPRYMEVKKDKENYLTGYTYKLDGVPIPFTKDEIIFHRYFNPTDAYEGLSASTPAGDSINADIASNDYNNEWFGNSAIPSAVLEVERRMSDEECNLLRRQWEMGHKKKGRRHRTGILFGGVKFNVIQKSPRDMEFTKQKVLAREEILAGYGVPPVMVGLLESVNYGNSKEQRKLFWTQTMRHKLRSLAERFTMEFGYDGQKRKFMFDLSDVEALQEDQEIKSRIAFNITKALLMTPDEVRRIFYKMQPLPGGVGGEIWVPTNMVPARLQMNGPVAAPKPVGQPGNPSGPDSTPESNGNKPDAAGTTGGPKKDFTEEELRQFVHKIMCENTNTMLVG